MSGVHAGAGLTKFQFRHFVASSRSASQPERWWLHGLLFSLTVLTTTAFGCGLEESFRSGRPFELESVQRGYLQLFHLRSGFLLGLYFSGPLLFILLAHEFGHYFACRYWRVDASLPFFLPSPTLLGTLGAFIRIRSPIVTRAMLLDIGIAGPIAGFVALLPFLVAGVFWSYPASVKSPDSITFGVPVLLHWLEMLRFPQGWDGRFVVFHPFAVAAWAGLLATSLNLMPMGQLDGGHITYAALGPRWHRFVSLLFIGLLGVLGFLYWAWWLWAVAMFLVGRHHPLVYDETPLSARRLLLSAASLLLLILSLSIVPISMN